MNLPRDRQNVSGSQEPVAGLATDLPSRDAWLDTIERLAYLDQPGDPSPLWTYVVMTTRTMK